MLYATYVGCVWCTWAIDTDPADAVMASWSDFDICSKPVNLVCYKLHVKWGSCDIQWIGMLIFNALQWGSIYNSLWHGDSIWCQQGSFCVCAQPMRPYGTSTYVIDWLNVSEWVIKFGDSGHWGPYSPYKLCNHTTINFKKKDIEKQTQNSEGTH